MKFKFSKYFTLFASVVLLSQCRPEPIDIDVPPAEEKMTVASQIIPNSIMVVGLTRSFSALDKGGNSDTFTNDFMDRILVTGATVTVTHPGGTDTLYMVNPGVYASANVLLQTAGSYVLRAKDSATGKEITAMTQLLGQENFDSITPLFKLLHGDSVPFIHYELTDSKATLDYYVICYYRKNQTSGIFDLNNYFTPGTNELKLFDLLTDQDFDANGKLIREQELTGVGMNDTIAVTVSHITRGYYEFLSAYQRAGKLFNQLTGEPINYPSNVQGGYGYFNTHYPDIRIYRLEEFH